MIFSKSLIQKCQFFFTRSKMEVVCIRDNPYGFEGQILQVKPGFYDQELFPKGYAIINQFGFKKRLMPFLNEKLLQEKLDYQKRVSLAMQKIRSLFLEFVRVPLFSNPDMVKDPISDQEIIDELENRFKFTLQKKDFQLKKKINVFGQTIISVENYYSEEIGKNISFSLRVMVKMFSKSTAVTNQDAAKEDKEVNKENN